MFAGILSRTDAPPDEEAAGQLLSALGRSGDEPRVYRDAHTVLALIDPTAPDAARLHQTADGVTALAGLPLLGGASAAADAEALAPLLAQGRLDALARCRGQFALAHWAPAERRLVMATDFCGVRPIFVQASDEWVVFGSALRLLEAVRRLELRMDLLGVTEEISFGFPLADRTPYENVRRLRSGEVWICDPNGLRRSFHSRLDQVVESARPVAELGNEAYERFLEAVRLRARDETDCVTFLSGGLDSRCVTAALVTLGKRVQCVNIARAGRLDSVLANRFAAALDVPLVAMTVPEGERQYVSKGLAFGRLRSDGRLAARTPRVFSGDGGSVGTGHDYLEDEHLRRMRAGDLAGAAAHALEQRGRPSRIAFRSTVHERFTRALQRSIERELRALDGPAEPGRKFHVFLMQNDQRRHLDHHFEELDRYRAELATPFFDAEYLRCILSIPVDACMRHAFYYSWLERFPPAVRHVAWQAYPGHLPCPVPLEAEDRAALSQWQTSRREIWRRVRDDFRACARTVLDAHVPAACGIGRGRALAALLLHASRVRNGMGLFSAVNAYHRYLERTHGRLTPIPDEGPPDPPLGLASR